MLERVKAMGRAMAEARMTAECVIYRKNGVRRDGVRSITLWRPVYDGRCEPMSRDEQSGTAGAEMLSTVTRSISQIRLPVGGYAPAVNDVAVIAASTDPQMVGAQFRITQPYPVGEHVTAYRPYVQHLDGDELAEFEQGEVTP